MKKIIYFLLFLLLSQCILAQNPSVVGGVATYTANMNIGRKFKVPDSWDKIVIKKNVTLTGSFYMGSRSKAIEICGEDRKTSILQGDGSRPTDDGINGRTYSAIRCDGSPDVYVHDMKVTKPMKFHVHAGFGKVTVERCDIIAGAHTATTDGIHGGLGQTVVRDCYIDVYDDALYTAECYLVENTTIVHNKNGGPLMTCWGVALPNKNHTCVIRNVKIIDNHDANDYNHGIVSWANRKEGGKETLTLKFEGFFIHEVAPGKVASPMYTFGRKTGGISDSHYIIDGICPRKNSIDYRGSKNCSVTFKNCDSCSDSVAPSVPSSITANNVTFNSVELDWNPSTDNGTLAGYEIFVNGVSKTTSSGNSITLNGLNCNSPQSISILAYDACGNESAKSTPISITTSECPPCIQIPTTTGGNGPEAGQTAYVPVTLPDIILAENMDEGANGVAYFDNGYGGNIVADRPIWSTEHGFRLTSDVEFDDDGGNVFIGGINSGEWAEYTVNVTTPGTYKLTSVTYFTNFGTTGAAIWFKMDDTASCLFDLPNTDKFEIEHPVDFEFYLDAGEHVFAWIAEGSKFNLESFTIESGSNVHQIVADEFEVYPNPFTNKITIKGVKEDIIIYDVSGRFISSIPVNNHAVINLITEDYKQGIYFIKSGNIIKRIVKLY
jgi:hypothetical protein